MGAPLNQSFGPGNVDELLTTSLNNMIPGIRDNVFKSNPVLKKLYEGWGGGKMRKRGGVGLSHGELYAVNDTAGSYQRYDVLPTTPQDGMTRDLWAWAQYAVIVSIDGFSERIANAGDSVIEDIMEVKKMQAEESLSLKLETHLFQASPGAKDIQSLATIVASSGTVGSINGSTSTWWASTATTSGSFAAQGRSDLTSAFNSISVLNPAGNPELIVSSQTEYQFYESSLVAQERFASNKNLDIGAMSLTFKGCPWVYSPQATTGTIYLLHPKGLEFIVNSDTDFLVKPFVEPTNQDARTSKILLACSLTTGNRRKLGKLTSVTA